MSLLVFVLCLPVAVWLLAAWYGLLDNPELSRALVAIAWRMGLVLAGIYLLGHAARAPALAALIAVLTLHVGWFVSTRWMIRSGRIAPRVVD